jgi:RimJ/RimL family protein N-acetyltransferase
VEPVEVNAGGYYLRALRADDRIDDRPAVLAAYADRNTARWIPEYDVRTLAEAGAYVAQRQREWRDDQRCSWAIAEPGTGQMLGEIGLKNLDFERGEAAVACWTHPAHRGRGVATHAVRTVLRFGFSALGLNRIEYWYAQGNEASARVAAKCGFTRLGILPGATEVDGEQRDLYCYACTAPAVDVAAPSA